MSHPFSGQPPQGPQGPKYQPPQQPGTPQGPYPPHQAGHPQGPQSHAEARAHAKAAKAHAKAMRPWFKKKRFILPLALVALVAFVTALNGGNDEAPVAAVPADSSSSAPSEPAANKTKEPTKTKEPAAPAAAGIGDKVVAGDWDFTVTKFKCGTKKIGSEYANQKAQGQFCLMNVSVKNNGKEAETLDGSNQKLLDAEGREFSSDGTASIYADPDSNLFLEQINPGNTKKGLVVFDVPTDAKPVQAVLAGGLLGGDTATVELKG